MEFDDRPDYAQRLEEARKNAGFSSMQKATERFGWSYPTYAQHEKGLRGIGRAAAKYAKAFKVSEAWLLTGEGGEGSEGISSEALINVAKRLQKAGVLPPDEDNEEGVIEAFLEICREEARKLDAMKDPITKLRGPSPNDKRQLRKAVSS
jgi:transcriptional regulator with XRE-family HTH domain